MSRLRPADWLAGAAGILLLVTLFLPWYGAPIGRPQASAWHAFGILDVLLALLALLAIALPVVTASARGPAKPVAFAVLGSVGSLLAVLLILYRLLNQPGPNELVSVRYGAWLGLLAALLMLAGAWGAMRDESTPGVPPPDVPRRPAP